MATVNEACAGLIDAVNSSGLDFSLNLTPYSLHFSIRRKFSKISKNSKLLKTNPSQDDVELLRLRSEYEKLYNFCQFETKQKSELEAELLKELNVKSELKEELSEAYKRLNLSTHGDNHAKKLFNENSDLKNIVNTKCIEIKQLKNQLEEIKKEKNALSVALKGKTQEIKEINQANTKKEEVLDKKVIELSEYKTRKMIEEREERIKKKKEIKKEKQKSKRLVNKDDDSNDPHLNSTEETKTDILETEKKGIKIHEDKDANIKGVEENEAHEKDLEDKNINHMSDKEFAEHMWMKFCGRPRPAKYSSQQEFVADELGDERNLDDV